MELKKDYMGTDFGEKLLSGLEGIDKIFKSSENGLKDGDLNKLMLRSGFGDLEVPSPK